MMRCLRIKRVVLWTCHQDLQAVLHRDIAWWRNKTQLAFSLNKPIRLIILWWWLALSRHLVAFHKRYPFWQNVTLWRKSITNLNHTLKMYLYKVAKENTFWYFITSCTKSNEMLVILRLGSLSYFIYSIIYLWCFVDVLLLLLPYSSRSVKVLSVATFLMHELQAFNDDCIVR